MATFKDITLIHTTRESAELEKAKLTVSTPVFVYEIEGHDGKVHFVIERHQPYAIGLLYSEVYGIKAKTEKKARGVTKDSVLKFLSGLSEEEKLELLK